MAQQPDLNVIRESIRHYCASVPKDWKPVFIYGLVDPETGSIRYIGQSIRPLDRLRNHINEKPTNCHRSHWIQSLKARGLEPHIVILESVAGAWPWQEAERHWIAKARALGWDITNNTSGGDGVPDLTPESRAKITAAWKGRKHTPESLAKMKESRKLHPPRTEASKRKARASMLGRKITWIDKIAEKLCKFTPEQEASVRARLVSGEKGIDLAREFGVHRTTITKIKKGTYRDQGV